GRDDIVDMRLVVRRSSQGTGTSWCSHFALASTRGKNGPTSVAIGGDFGTVSNTSITSYVEVRTPDVMQPNGAPYEAFAGHASTWQFGNGCKSCIQGNYQCSSGGGGGEPPFLEEPDETCQILIDLDANGFDFSGPEGAVR